MSAVAAVIICILSVLGLSALIWSVAGAFLLPVQGGENCHVHIVVDAKGDCSQLQCLIRSLDWVADIGIVEFDTFIVDNGMDQQSLQMAQVLARRESVSICSPDRFCELLKSSDDRL